MKVKEESEKVGLKLNIQKTKIMASCSITSWQVDGETMERVADFIFGGSKITVDGDCSPELRRYSLAGKYDQPRQHIKKQRHYFAKKDPSSQSYGFPAVMYECCSWTMKKAEHQIIDAFELWCWRRLLRVPWTARRSNLSILKEIIAEYSLEGLMLRLKFQYLASWCEELTHLKRPWWWERLRVGGEGDDRGWNGCMASPTQWTWVWVNYRSWWCTRKSGMLQSMGLQIVRHDWVSELNWIELSSRNQIYSPFSSTYFLCRELWRLGWHN